MGDLTAQEDRILGNIDRMKGKATTSARTLAVREMAKGTVNCAVMDQPEEDRAVFLQEAVNHLGTLYTASQGAEATVSLFGKLSRCPTFAINRAVANARAEQAFAKLAANDRGEGQ